MKLYALLDYETLIKKEWSIERFISTCKALHVEVIQYRDKKGDRKRKVENLKKIRLLYDKTLIINDDIDLVCYCDGLHMGQEDIKNRSIDNIREEIGRKILGISTHNREEIIEANRLDIDYIGLGAYRSTKTKIDASVLKESLSDLARLSFKPVAAIGGVRVDDKIEGVRYAVVGTDIYEY